MNTTQAKTDSPASQTSRMPPRRLMVLGSLQSIVSADRSHNLTQNIIEAGRSALRHPKSLGELDVVPATVATRMNLVEEALRMVILADDAHVLDDELISYCELVLAHYNLPATAGPAVLSELACFLARAEVEGDSQGNSDLLANDIEQVLRDQSRSYEVVMSILTRVNGWLLKTTFVEDADVQCAMNLRQQISEFLA
jgi:hypothetical protein